MNAPHAPAKQSNLTPVPTKQMFKMDAHERTERRDHNDWLEMQDDAEVSFLVEHMTAQHGRATRMSAYG